MWGSRSRSKVERDRYESRIVDRLRGVGEAAGSTRDADEVRERLGRMRHGASRQPEDR